MFKKTLVLAMALLLSLSVSGCGEKKTLHCDHCNTEVKVGAKSNMTEEWIIYCEDCNEELFGDDSVLNDYENLN